MKRAILLVGCACWGLFALGFAAVLVGYVLQGAGLQVSAWLFSSRSVVIGTGHVIGFVMASVICFAISAALWVRAFAGASS